MNQSNKTGTPAKRPNPPGTQLLTTEMTDSPNTPSRETSGQGHYYKTFHIDRACSRSIFSIAHESGLSSASVLLYSFWEILRNWAYLTDQDQGIFFISDNPAAKGCALRLDSDSGDGVFGICRKIEDQLKTNDDKAYDIRQPGTWHQDIKAAMLYRLKPGTFNNEIKECPLQCMVYEGKDFLEITWNVSESVYPQARGDHMASAHRTLLEWIGVDYLHGEMPDLLPWSQRIIRQQVNHTSISFPKKLIHQDFFEYALNHSQETALIWEDEENPKDACSMSYGELSEASCQLAFSLLKKGLKKQDRVAVILPKGKKQIISVLGVLCAGATYIPIGVDHPEKRQHKILRIGEVKYIVTDSFILEKFPSLSTLSGISVVDIDTTKNEIPLAAPVANHPTALAYIIFTSGSTGYPKGVEITHEGAWNTIADINTKYAMTSQDRVLALSALDFDLSVYDIFGLLSVGGALVLLREETRRDALAWLKLIEQHQVTVWNSVPALLDMLLVHASDEGDLSSLNVVLVSGDWVGLDLPRRLKRKTPDSRLIALGGATEASIWSNYFEVGEVPSHWNSIPYGKPLANQQYRVVNSSGRDCPDMVTGELWIGGKGIARGYAKNPELTRNQFVDYRGEKWYRTGDLGRYWPDGTIEFLGRRDQQVKLRGYRIELGEVEAALKSYHGISQSIATILSINNRQHLVAGVVGEHPKATDVLITESRIEEKQRDPIRHIKEGDSSMLEAIRLQADIVTRFLIDLLRLDQLLDPVNSDIEFWKGHLQVSVSDDQTPVLRMWQNWLETEGVLVSDQGRFTAGPQLKKALDNNHVDSKDNARIGGLEKIDHSLFQRIKDRLHSKIEDFQKILNGSLSAVSLLDDEVLSPEWLSAHDSGTNSGIEKIADKINRTVQEKKEPIHIAILGGRTGLLVEKLLVLVHKGHVHFTLLDEGRSMVDDLSKRFSNGSHQVSMAHMAGYQIPDKLRYHFDLVIAINALHRYPESMQGLFITSMLLKRMGTLYALEHEAMSPIALVTSAVIDRGYAHFDRPRREVYSPMLNGKEWVRRLQDAGFNRITCTPISGSMTILLEAMCPLHRLELDLDSILAHVSDILPPHMVPETVVALPWLPLNANGKLDRKSFLLNSTEFQRRNETLKLDPPKEGMEREIATMWQDLLKFDQISRDQGFFQIGGDSLLATRFLTMVKERFDVDMSFREIFDAPLSKVAKEIEKKRKELETESVTMVEGEI